MKRWITFEISSLTIISKTQLRSSSKKTFKSLLFNKMNNFFLLHIYKELLVNMLHVKTDMKKNTISQNKFRIKLFQGFVKRDFSSIFGAKKKSKPLFLTHSCIHLTLRKSVIIWNLKQSYIKYSFDNFFISVSTHYIFMLVFCMHLINF